MAGADLDRAAVVMTRPTHPHVRPGPHPRRAEPVPSESAPSEPAPSGLDGSGGGRVGSVVDLDEVLAAQPGPADPPTAGPGSGVLTMAQMARLPASLSLLEAARALGIGRTSAYQLARDGQFPCPLIKVGVLYRVPTVGLLRILGLAPSEAAASHGDE